MAVKIYEFEIALKDIEPRIWRKFAVSGNIGLKKLHHVVQIVMGWEDRHVHLFEIGDEKFAIDGYRPRDR